MRCFFRAGIVVAKNRIICERESHKGGSDTLVDRERCLGQLNGLSICPGPFGMTAPQFLKGSINSLILRINPSIASDTKRRIGQGGSLCKGKQGDSSERHHSYSTISRRLFVTRAFCSRLSRRAVTILGLILVYSSCEVAILAMIQWPNLTSELAPTSVQRSFVVCKRISITESEPTLAALDLRGDCG